MKANRRYQNDLDDDEEEVSPVKDRASFADSHETKLWVELDKSLAPLTEYRKPFIDEEVLQSIRSKMGNKIFCGLPPYALPQTTAAMTYQSRKAMVENLRVSSALDYSTDDNTTLVDENKPSTGHSLLKKMRSSTSREFEPVVQAMTGNNYYAAQRKVSQALLTMANNDAMIKYFLHKGGLDAVQKLIRESIKNILTLLSSLTLETF